MSAAKYPAQERFCCAAMSDIARMENAHTWGVGLSPVIIWAKRKIVVNIKVEHWLSFFVFLSRRRYHA